MLISSLADNDEFNTFFTLPIHVSHDAIDFDGRNYAGVAVETQLKQATLDAAVLDCWRKNVFAPFCRFLDDGFSDYFVQKGE
jgi:hypothetical protein